MSDQFDENWDTIPLRDYLECMQIIHRKNLVLFASCKGTGKREEKDKKVICDRVRTIRKERCATIYSIRTKPKLLSDLLESTTAALFLDGGMQKCGSGEPSSVGATRCSIGCSAATWRSDWSTARCSSRRPRRFPWG